MRAKQLHTEVKCLGCQRLLANEEADGLLRRCSGRRVRAVCREACAVEPDVARPADGLAL